GTGRRELVHRARVEQDDLAVGADVGWRAEGGRIHRVHQGIEGGEDAAVLAVRIPARGIVVVGDDHRARPHGGHPPVAHVGVGAAHARIHVEPNGVPDLELGHGGERGERVTVRGAGCHPVAGVVH
ncbi:MAG: hypothetical protein ACK55I_35465, partial [bacterium]